MRREVLSKMRVRLRSCFRSAVASLHGTGARRALSFLTEGEEMKIEKDVALENGTRMYNATEITEAVADSDIRVIGFFVHKKASEKYAVTLYREKGCSKEWLIPYQYRRTNTFIDTLKDLVELLRTAKSRLTQQSIESYKKRIQGQTVSMFGRGANVTIPIFERLLNNCGEWVLNKDFDNENPQRRIQDIKETGFTLATKFGEGRATYHMLLPFEPVKAATYETIPANVRNMIFKVHGGINAYTGTPSSTSCLPDHKFPEIRWDKDTPDSNENLTPQEMLEKFQIVPENINQMKREVCRGCFQTGKRGKLNGINYFYKGKEDWDSSIPKTGKAAEKGCVGCFWYDMLAWRKSLHEKLGVKK